MEVTVDRAASRVRVKNTATTDQTERKRLFDQVQKIIATEQPVLHFAAANTVVAAGARDGERSFPLTA